MNTTYNRIGIMGAMPEEIDAIKANMRITEQTTIADRTFYVGKFGNQEIVLVFSRWGKTAAASTVTKLINVFDVDFVLFTGVAGAVSPDLNIGDIVIASDVYHHDMDARPIFKRFQTPLTGTTYFQANDAAVAAAQTAATHFINTIQQQVPDTLLNTFTITQPKVSCGTVASGDRFVENASQSDCFQLDNKTVLAVEMEGAAVAQVCDEHSTPFCLIRTISDKADHSATIDFQAFVKDIASQYALGIVSKLL